MNRDAVLQKLTPVMPELRRRFGVQELALFGSAARNEAGAGSDLDFVVSFEGLATFDRFMDLRFYLEDLFDVRIDLVTRNALRPELKTTVEREAVHVP
jgi:predicted nucleotidyltransferase